MRRNVLIRCAAILLAAILGLAVVDNARPWKRLQVEFFELERQQLQSQLDASRVATRETLTGLEAEVEAQEALLAGRQDEIIELEDDLRRFGGKLYAAQLRQSRLESERAVIDEGADAAVSLASELRETRIEIESFNELIADREGKLGAVRSNLEVARENLARASAPIEMLEHRLAALPARPILPLSGLLAPGVAVRETSLPSSTMIGSRVDRCVTCHLAADRDDLENGDWPAPFGRHPSPELFLGADSPHPYKRFGCTTCHGGDGRATDFARAGHMPMTSEQADTWQQHQGWNPSDQPATMLPLDLTEAACAHCHGGESVAPRALVLNQGQQLIVALGCTACHVSGQPSLAASAKIGPSLIGIAGKTTAAWAHRWLEAPRAVRGATRMPHVFEPGQTAEIRAVVDYLWQVSRPAAYETPPAGDIEAGRGLFQSIGCSGCHLLGLETDVTSIEQSHGPHLAGTGSKVTADWLYAWLRDPRAYRFDTPMPSLRLDESETADLTAYLMTRRDPAWEGLSLPAVDTEARDRLALSVLAGSHTIEQSQARFERMSERDKNVYLGEQTIAKYGCYGCHEIAGFEQATVTGPTLREVSDSLRQRLMSPGSTAPGTLLQSRPEPRGRWSVASHRPAYLLNDAEAQAVTVALLGLAGERAAAPADERIAALGQGRRILAHYNCGGCHRIEGKGGDGSSPDLAHVGARLKAAWLYEYLADPGGREVRPWLDVRMPTFGLSEVENNALVRYFAMLDRRPLFADAPRAPRLVTDVAVGRVVFGMLQCGDCHRPASEESTMPQVAPAHRQASERLRPDWVVDLILDPERWLPGTNMPANFLPDDDGELGSSFLIGSINTPIFAVERDRLLRLLGSDEELNAYLSDPERVAAALRDYLWTLGK